MDQGGMFEFCDEDLQFKSFTVFQQMQASGELCDVVINANVRSFAAHRVILSSAIPFFRAMFHSKLKESIEGEVFLTEADPVALESVISFAYTGKLKIPKSGVQSLLQLSIFLQLDSVIDACFVALVKEMEAKNVLSLRAFAENVNHMKTVEIADCFIKENFDDVSATQSFLDMPLSVLRGLLCRNDLNVTSEQVVFEAVLEWVKSSKAERKPFLRELLAEVKLCLLTPEYLARVCLEDELLRTDPCRIFLEQERNSFETENSSNILERYCKEKHHLKCEKVMGVGMYSIMKGASSGEPQLLDYLLKSHILYYDVFKRTWVGFLDVRETWSFSYAVCLKNQVYLISGGGIHTIHLSTYETSSLNCKFSIPVGGSIVLHNCHTYILGSPRDSERSVYFLDLQEGVFDEVGEIVKFRKRMGVASLGEHIYVTGGEDPVLQYILVSVEKYNPVTGRSKLVAPMHYARSGHGCAALGGKLYVCGGKCEVPASVEVYNCAADQWTIICPMKSQMPLVSLVPYDGKLYAAEICHKKLASCVETYDPQQNEWNCGTSMPPFLCGIIVTNSAAMLQS